MIKQDNLYRAALYRALKKKGMAEDDAVEKALRSLPYYGDDPGLTGADRPLFHEMKVRVIPWRTRNGLANGATLDYSARGFTSMNALIRSEMREGRL